MSYQLLPLLLRLLIVPLLQELDAAAAELAASAPNLKAVEQYEAVREKEKQQVRVHALQAWLPPCL